MGDSPKLNKYGIAELRSWCRYKSKLSQAKKCIDTTTCSGVTERRPVKYELVWRDDSNHIVSCEESKDHWEKGYDKETIRRT